MGSTVSKKRKNNRCSAVNKKVSDTSTRSKTSIVSKTSKASQTSNCSSHDVKSSNSCNKGKKCSECKASRNSCDYYTIEQPVDLSKGSNNSRCMSKSYQSCPDKSPTCTRSEMKETKVSEEEEACPCNCGFYQEGEIAVFPCGCDPQAESLKNEKKEATSKSSLQKPIVTDCGGQGGNSSHKVASNCIESTKSSSSTNRQPLKNILTNTNEQTESQKTVDKLQKDMSSVQKKSEALQKLIENCCCAENPIFPHKSASSSPIKATHSGLTAAIKFLQAKCRTKDGMIAILAQELRNSIRCKVLRA
ncbi:uncharacterized protein LOC105703566 [Orussus abietinus]|uniref:uncharacterized protein LOC105703566 n=1 Tax=Orussus abietinus TaxID=222816 RepID=UPI000C715BC8|nr:uncharacterized protein LOC105703566 [Orussus abietinus]